MRQIINVSSSLISSSFGGVPAVLWGDGSLAAVNCGGVVADRVALNPEILKATEDLNSFVEKLGAKIQDREEAILALDEFESSTTVLEVKDETPWRKDAMLDLPNWGEMGKKPSKKLDEEGEEINIPSIQRLVQWFVYPTEDGIGTPLPVVDDSFYVEDDFVMKSVIRKNAGGVERTEEYVIMATLNKRVQFVDGVIVDGEGKKMVVPNSAILVDGWLVNGVLNKNAKDGSYAKGKTVRRRDGSIGIQYGAKAPGATPNHVWDRFNAETMLGWVIEPWRCTDAWEDRIVVKHGRKVVEIPVKTEGVVEIFNRRMDVEKIILHHVDSWCDGVISFDTSPKEAAEEMADFLKDVISAKIQEWVKTEMKVKQTEGRQMGLKAWSFGMLDEVVEIVVRDELRLWAPEKERGEVLGYDLIPAPWDLVNSNKETRWGRTKMSKPAIRAVGAFAREYVKLGVGLTKMLGQLEQDWWFAMLTAYCTTRFSIVQQNRWGDVKNVDSEVEFMERKRIERIHRQEARKGRQMGGIVRADVTVLPDWLIAEIEELDAKIAKIEADRKKEEKKFGFGLYDSVAEWKKMRG